MADIATSDAFHTRLRHVLQRYQLVARYCLGKRDFTQATAYLAKICSILDNLDQAVWAQVLALGRPVLELQTATPTEADGEVSTQIPLSDLDLALVTDLNLNGLLAGAVPTSATASAAMTKRRPPLDRAVAELRGISYWNLGDGYQRAGNLVLAETAYSQSSDWFYRGRHTASNLMALERLADVVELLGKQQLAGNLRRRQDKIRRQLTEGDK